MKPVRLFRVGIVIIDSSGLRGASTGSRSPESGAPGNPVTTSKARMSTGHTRLLDDCRQDRCLARLGPGVRREALHAAAHPVWVWLSSGLQSAGHRDEAWLERGLPSS